MPSLFCLSILAAFMALSACTTTPSSVGNKDVPPRPLLHFSTYEFHCDNLPINASSQDVEDHLKRFGNEGWQVAMPLVRSGQTVGVCFQR